MGRGHRSSVLYHLPGPRVCPLLAQYLLAACRLADQAADVGRSTEVAALQNASSLAGESLLAIVMDSVTAGYTSQEAALNASYASNSTSQVCTMYSSMCRQLDLQPPCTRHSTRPESAVPAAARLHGSRVVLMHCSKRDTTCMPSMAVI